jgi:hypothetical protein
MSYNWNKFDYLVSEEGPTDAEIKAANKAVHQKDKNAAHPKSPAGKLAAAANKRYNVKKKYFGGKTDPSQVDTKAAIAKHKADIRAAGEASRGKLDDWTAYRDIGRLISEVLTPGQHAEVVRKRSESEGEMAANRRTKRVKAVMKGKGIGEISAKRALGKKGVSLSKGAAQQKAYRDKARKKGNDLGPEPRGGRFG